MKNTIITWILTALSTTAFAQGDQKMAEDLFKQLEQKAFFSAPQNLYVGGPPHGPVRAVVEGQIGQKHTIVKFNYGGKNITPTQVKQDPGKWLKAITVMHRVPGYDGAHNDWFWAKYEPSGEIFIENGQIRMGKDKGCIACHQSASGNDFTFQHNKIVNADTTVVN